MNKLLLSFLLTLPCALYSIDDSLEATRNISLYESGWAFLKEKFVTKPQAQYLLSCPKLRRAAGVLIPFLGSGYITLSRMRYGTEVAIPLGLMSLVGFSFLSYKTCSSLNSYLISYLDKKNAIEFIQNWERNKKHSPVEVHELFDDIYGDYKKNPELIKPDLTQIINTVKAAIQKHLPKK